MADSSVTDAPTETQIEDARRRGALIQALRDCADFFEQHPAVTAPRYNLLNVFVNSRDEIAAQARAATWEKVYNGHWFILRRAFGEDLALEINTSRETVCRKVVIGSKTVPAQPALIVEDVEWICEESLLAESGAR